MVAVYCYLSLSVGIIIGFFAALALFSSGEQKIECMTDEEKLREIYSIRLRLDELVESFDGEERRIADNLAGGWLNTDDDAIEKFNEIS
jgi:hypothetical protein